MDPSDVTVAFGIFNIPLKDGRIFKQTGDVVAQAASNTGQKAVTISDLASTKGFDARIAPDKGKVWQALDPKVKGQVWTQDASGKWLPSSQSAPPIPNGLQSSTFFQQVVAGKAKTTSGESMTSVHFETTDIDPLMTAGHPESELRSAIATTAAGQHEIDVYFYERGKLSKLPAGSNIVEGDPLPDRIGKFFPNQGKPPTTPSTPPKTQYVPNLPQPASLSRTTSAAAGKVVGRALVPFLAEAEDFLSHYGDPYKIPTLITAAAAAKAYIQQSATSAAVTVQAGAAKAGAAISTAAQAASTFLIGLGSRLIQVPVFIPKQMLQGFGSGSVPEA